jgi:transketolase
VDYNGQQIDGTVDSVLSLGDLKAKWLSFGWEVVEVDGHDYETLKNCTLIRRKEYFEKRKTTLYIS